MAFVMPEIVVQRVLQRGLKNLRENPDAFNEIFGQFLCSELTTDYGQAYLDEIRQFIFETKIPVVQAWALNPQRIPCYSIHLANEAEDEQKAAIGDFYGDAEDNTVSTGVFTVYIDIGIHGNKTGDMVIWMYYVLAYIMFKEKLIAEKLGLQLHTWSASDHQRVDQKLPENVWTRRVRFKCTTQNWLAQEPFVEVEDTVVTVVPDRIGSDDGDLS